MKHCTVRKAIAASLFGMLVTAETLLAQEMDSFAFDGHVFDSQTLRPVSGVIIQLWENFDDGTARFFQAISDAGGFYAVEMPQNLTPPNKTGHAIVAICNTKKGAAYDGGPTYLVLRSERYRRDFYVAVPKGQKCNPNFNP